jgi:hypothetical protein
VASIIFYAFARSKKRGNGRGYAVTPATLPAGHPFISWSTSRQIAARTNITTAILSGCVTAQATVVA